MVLPVVHAARIDELGVRTFHDIVRLRLDVFVVEQDCPYPELDGRDLLATTRHLWIEEDGEVLSYLRVYPGADGATWIGRVVTAAAHRDRGLGATLMRHALTLAQQPVRISAQARLQGWYARFGFSRCGDDFIEDGIPHTPMVLAAGGAAPAVPGTDR
jgi:ElaA protein